MHAFVNQLPSAGIVRHKCWAWLFGNNPAESDLHVYESSHDPHFLAIKSVLWHLSTATIYMFRAQPHTCLLSCIKCIYEETVTVGSWVEMHLILKRNYILER